MEIPDRGGQPEQREAPVPGLPTGTVTFLFTDIVGSTRLLQQLGDHYADVLAEYRRLLRTVSQEKGGKEVDTQGDTFFAAFPRARDAVVAAVAAQRAIAAHSWPAATAVRARMGLHTGEPVSAESGYVGIDVHRAARICASGHSGQIVISRTTCDLIEDDLPEGMDLRDLGKHRLKDLAGPQHLFQVVVAGLPADFPPLKTLERLPNNLPIQMTSFIGRENEIGEVKHLLTTARIVTLTGAGGSGKTRLALQVAADLLEEYPDGVWLAELATLVDPALVPQTVALALGMREEANRPLVNALADFLRAKSLLLLLDNCEHLRTTCARLAGTLLSACPSVRILATSQEGLGIAGECSYPVPSLSLPDSEHPPSVEDLLRCEAVRLFIDRARLSNPGFQVTPRDIAAIAEVCYRLDGIPLAIEFAAARLKVLSAKQIAARLEDRFRLLTGGSRTAVPRHQTLRATMDWSYALLSEKERTLLRRLSVFAGGCTLEAMESVCAGAGVEADEVLDLLTSDVDKSLVLADVQSGEARYRLLETVRQYCWDKLLESGETAIVRTRHRDWFLSLAEQAELERYGLQQGLWLERLTVEHDNLRMALVWSKVQDGTAAGLRLAGALWWFWYIRGYLREGREWLEDTLAKSNEAPSSARAKAMYAAGLLALRHSDYRRAAQLAEESLILSRKLGDERGVAFSLGILGLVAGHLGDYEQAVTLSEQSLSLARGVGDRWGVAFSQDSLGIVARLRGDYELAKALGEENLVVCQEVGDKWGVANAINRLGLVARDQGDYERATGLLEESLTLHRELGDKFGATFSQTNLGIVARLQGDYNQARALVEESLAICQELGDKWGVAYALQSLGLVAGLEGDNERASRLLKESVTLYRDLGEKRGIAFCLTGFAKVAMARRQPERAARLFGATEALRESIGMPQPPFDRADHDRYATLARAELGGEAFAAAWDDGRVMKLDQAIEYALVDSMH